VIGYTDLALMGLAKADPLHAMLAEVRTSADRAAAISRQLLVFSRRHPVEFQTIDVSSTVERLAKMLRRLIGEDVVLSLSLAPDAFIRADEGQIEQIVTNLCVNARDAMAGGGKLLIPTADADAHAVPDPLVPPQGPPAAGWIAVSVTDTGTGMSPEVQARIFEPFFTTKPIGQGTGLGLAVVHGIVAKHGGAIQVETEVGRGTTLRIFLPRSAAGATARPSAPREVALPRGTETVLVVDDEEMVADLAERVLARLGYRVLVASSPYEAIGLADRHAGAIDLLLTDVVMPGLGGPELEADLARRRGPLRTLFMSGYTGEKLAKNGVLAPGQALLAKPFSGGALARKVREVLDRPK
jgi:two-component system cell cycle sensor histidine kinase/response regulator CckA